MTQPAKTCSACHRPKTRGSHDQSGDIFICDQCQADARQFIEIQKSIHADVERWDETTDATEVPENP